MPGNSWTVAKRWVMTTNRTRILTLLSRRRSVPWTRAEIAAETTIPTASLGRLLPRMADAGEIESAWLHTTPMRWQITQAARRRALEAT